MTTNEWRIINYLDKHDIYKGSVDMQFVIINSFYVERIGTTSESWKEVVKYTQDHFGLFAQYANNNWKQKSHT